MWHCHGTGQRVLVLLPLRLAGSAARIHNVCVPLCLQDKGGSSSHQHHRLALCGVTAIYAVFVLAGIFAAPILYYAVLSPVNEFLGMRWGRRDGGFQTEIVRVFVSRLLESNPHPFPTVTQ